MNFEELYEKYLNKTATQEEIVYVESEIAKAKRLSAILDERDASRVIAPTETKTAKQSVKSFLKKTRLRVAAIVMIVTLLVSALAVGSFFTVATIKASSNSLCDKAEAIEFIVRTESELLGMPLCELAIKPDILIAGIIRDRQAIIPGGNDVITMGDRVVVLAAADHRLQDLTDIMR